MVLTLLAARLTLPVKHRSLLQNQYRRHNVAENPRRPVELDPFATGDIASYQSADDPNGHLDFGFDFSLLAQEKRIRRKQFTAKFTVHRYRPNEVETSLCFAAMIDNSSDAILGIRIFSPETHNHHDLYFGFRKIAKEALFKRSATGNSGGYWR